LWLLLCVAAGLALEVVGVSVPIYGSVSTTPIVRAGLPGPPASGYITSHDAAAYTAGKTGFRENESNKEVVC
jgi:hypothetical protein